MRTLAALSVAVVLSVAVTSASADVFNMGGTRNSDGSWNGLASLEFVMVGDPGNIGELSGAGAGGVGWGPDRICGQVDYIYRMGKFEVTAGQYADFLNAVARSDTYGLYNTQMSFTTASGCNIQRSGTSGNYTYNVAADWANRPVSCVSWGSAARFANWLTNGQPTGAQGLNITEDGSYYLNGGRSRSALLAVTRKANAAYVIPSEDEWYKAAYYDPSKPGGAGYWDYPTRSNSVPSNQLLTPDPGNNANCMPYSGSFYTIGAPYYRTVIGEFERSESPYGTFDQGGNLWEWNEAVLSDTYGSYRGQRGGSFDTYNNNLSASTRWRYDPTNQGYENGFRIALVPEPATLSLLALGSLLIARRRRACQY